MSPQHKALLTAAFNALGPERVARGLTATGHSWRDCFLAIAMSGEPDALARDLDQHWRKHYVIGTLIGMRCEWSTRSSEPGITTRNSSGRSPPNGWN
jgi:hypothetical protein